MPQSNVISRQRRGSVLILVVVVVVLLALLGTALLSTSRGDRFTAQQHAYNTQVDLLIDSLKAVSQGAIDRGLYGKDPTGGTSIVFRPQTATAVPPTAGDYHNYDAPNFTTANVYNFADSWLSPRAPMLTAAAPVGPGSVYTGAWASVGTFLVGSSFESPVVWKEPTGVSVGTIDLSVSAKSTQTVSSDVAGTFLFEPTSFKLPSDGKSYPAFRKLIGGFNYDFMAGDADGDGIADSGMFRIPVGQIDGVDYFGAVRIVDAASQVNLNTAWSRSGDFATGAQATQAGITDATTNAALALGATDFANNLGWFQSHVGLEELLNRTNTFTPNIAFATPYTRAGAGAWNSEPNAFGEMLALNRYRFGYASNTMTGIMASDEMHQDSGQKDGTTPFATAVPVAGAFPGVNFLTQGDALEHQLAFRMRNPGLGVLGAGPTLTSFGSFSINSAISLAYHGGLMINPDIGKSLIESTFFNARNTLTLAPAIPPAMPDSIYSSAGNFKDNDAPIKNGLATGVTGYGADQMWRWLLDYYNTDATALRNVHDTNSAAAFTPSNYPNSTPATAFPTYACARPFVTTWNPVSDQVSQPPSPVAPATQLPAFLTAGLNNLNYRQAQSKVSVNTGSFSDLWLAYWSAMSDTPANGYSPFGASTYGTIANLYQGMLFDSSQVTFPAVAGAHPQRMFRSSIRDFHTNAPAPIYLDPANQIALRSAIAAVQTIQLRRSMTAAGKGAAIPYYKDIELNDNNASALTVRVFGTNPQPFISEVFIQTDIDYSPGPGTNSNPKGYAAVELYNPFDTAVTLDASYELVACSRVDDIVGDTYPVPAFDSMNAAMNTEPPTANSFDRPVPWTLPAGGLVIPAHGWALIENLNAPPNRNNAGVQANNAALHRPMSSGLPVDGSLPAGLAVSQIAQADLSVAYDKELILRHRVSTLGQPIDFCAIDSFWMEIAVGPIAGNARDYHYCRASGTLNNNNWRCVYPGRIQGYETGGELFRQQGEERTATYATSATADNDPWMASGPTPAQPTDPDSHAVNFDAGSGGAGGSPTNPIALGAADQDPSWQNVAAPKQTTFTIPLGGGTDSPGPINPNGAGNTFPFGAFAREGDILQVPFIGAYTIQQANGGGFVEMNSISTDSAYAEDTEIDDDEQDNTGAAGPNSTKNAAGTLPIVTESIGRFCPLQIDTGATPFNDLDPSSNYAGSWRYRWATRLFDYLTVQSATNDFLPNVDSAYAGLAAAPLAVDNDGDTYGNGKASNPALPVPPAHTNTEDVEPRQGLININTAPWQVLATLPMFKTGNNYTEDPPVPPSMIPPGTWTAGASAADPVDDNVKLAKAIVLYRDGDPAHGILAKGPFHSIFDLYNVPAFAGANLLLMDYPLGPTGPDASQGDFTPLVTSATIRDWARFDYKEQFLLLNKISNLITVRSDSFVVYIEVQGWRNLGTQKAELAVQRRVAFIQDRWKRTKTDAINAAIPVPND